LGYSEDKERLEKWRSFSAAAVRIGVGCDARWTWSG
jgi:hypothetical protein